MNKRVKLLCLLLILISGAIIRIYGLGKENLWYDEVGSIDIALRNFADVFSKFHNSPFYYLFLKYWIKIWGFSEQAVRWPSVIFGVVSIFMIHKVGKELFNENAGLISAFFLSLSPLHIFYSQEAKSYSLFVLLTLVSMHIFIRILTTGRAKLYFYLALINGLIVYTHLYGILIVIIQNVFYFLKSRPNKRWMISQALVLMFFLVWLVPIIITFISEPWIKVSTAWIAKPHPNDLLDTWRTFCYGGRGYGGSDIYIDPQCFWKPHVFIILYGMVFLLGLFQYQQYPVAILLLFLWLFLSVLLPFIFSAALLPFYVIRYTIFALPAFFLIVSAGIDKIKNRKIQVSVVIILLIFIVQSLSVYYNQNLKIAYRKAINYVYNNIKKDDVIIVSLAEEVRLFGYYGRNGLEYNRNKQLDIDRNLGSKLVSGGFVYSNQDNKFIGINKLVQLKKIINAGAAIEKDSSICLVISRWAIEEKEIVAYLETFYKNTKKSVFPGITVYFYAPFSP